MRFTQSELLALPCRLAAVREGELHRDGRRYLPLLLLELPPGPPGAVAQVGVVDRHHVVDLADEGRSGAARLVFLLSRIRRLPAGGEPGLFDQHLPPGRASTMPTAVGRVVAVPTWEEGSGHLPYESLYAELVVDVGVGTIGVRTSATADSLAEQIGGRIAPGDVVEVTRSRVDILGFEAAR